MTTREILEYAKDNGFNSVMFSVKNKDGGQVCVGKFLDAYYEFINIPLLGDGFVRIKDLEDQLGYNIRFEVIDEKQYNSGAYLDFVLREKTPPQSVIDKFNAVCSA